MTTRHERAMCPQPRKSNMLAMLLLTQLRKAREVTLCLYSGKASSDKLCPDVEFSVET